MRRFALLPVLLLLLLSTPLRAERYDIEKHSAVVNIPDSEGWFRRAGPPLRVGEFVVFAYNSSTKGFFGVAAIPGFPTTDIRHPNVLSRIMDTMRALGPEPTRQRFGTHNDLDYVEVIGGSTTDTGDKFVTVARGVLRNQSLYITMQSSKGAEEDADKPEFMQNIETLRFNVPVVYERIDISTTDPHLKRWHGRVFRIAALLVAVLAPAFFGMLFITRRDNSR